MKQTMKRTLALVMALLLALPTFALADEDESIVLQADGGEVYAEMLEDPVDEAELLLGADSDIIDTEGEAHPEGVEDEASGAAFDVGETVPEGFVRVSVAVTPVEALVAIYALDGETPIEPQIGADWLLAPGTYEYSAWAEGFTLAERVVFEVPAQDEPFELEIRLDRAKSISGDAEGKTVEPSTEEASETTTGETTVEEAEASVDIAVLETPEEAEEKEAAEEPEENSEVIENWANEEASETEEGIEDADRADEQSEQEELSETEEAERKEAVEEPEENSVVEENWANEAAEETEEGVEDADRADDQPEADALSEQDEQSEVPVEQDAEAEPIWQAQPVRVVVVVKPEDAAVEISAADGEATFSPDEQGDYFLLPGEYQYSAYADGYIAIEHEPFTVPEYEIPAMDDAEESDIAEAAEAPDETEIPDETIEIEAETTELPGAVFTLEIVMEPAPVAFEQSRTVDGVVVTVTAEAGAFPADAALSVSKVPAANQAEADAAVEEARDDAANVAVSYTFDISVIDAEGNELQPAEGFAVAVSFALAQVADDNLETAVYHITEDGSGELTADRLDAVEDADTQTVTAETDGFSLYTVEFTYNALQYVLEGGASVALGEILSAVGLTGEAESAAVSDESLFSVAERDGVLTLESHKPFLTLEWLRVVVGGVEFEITVTDEASKSIAYIDKSGASVTVTAYIVAAYTAKLTEGW